MLTFSAICLNMAIFKAYYSRMSTRYSFCNCCSRSQTINLYHSQSNFSRRNNDDIFLIFLSRNQVLPFHVNYLLGDSLHEISNHFFLVKLQKIVFKIMSSMLSI